MGKKYYSVAEVAKLFEVSTWTIRRLVAADKLRSVKIGRQHRLPADQFDFQEGKDAAIQGASGGRPVV